MSTEAANVSGMASSRKVSKPKKSSPAMKLRQYDLPDNSTQLKVAKHCTAVSSEITDPNDPRVTVYQDKKGKKLLAMELEGCLSSTCKELSDGLSLLLRDRADLLLRSVTVDIERTACWLYLHHMGVLKKRWYKCTKVSELFTIFGLPADHHEDIVRRKIAQWWSQQPNSGMSDDQVEEYLQSFYLQRKRGNAVAHPLLKDFGKEHLLKLANLRCDDEFETALNILFSSEIMEEDKKLMARTEDLWKFELKKLTKPDSKELEILKRVELPPANRQEYEKKLAAAKAKYFQ